MKQAVFSGVLALATLTSACQGQIGNTGGVEGEGGDDPNRPAAIDPAPAIPGEIGPGPAGTPPPESLKLLRGFEYQNTIRDLLGANIKFNVAFDPDLVAGGFSAISAASDCRDARAVEAYETSAIDVAAQAFAVTPHPLAAAGCAPVSADDPCVGRFLRGFGLRAWRRPLTETEVTRYAGLLTKLAADLGGNLIKAAELTVTALLQSPFFLYRVDLGQPVGNGDAGLKTFSPYQMASRLSYALWETTPDPALLTAAGGGELADAASVKSHAERMLDDPRSRSALSRFWREFMGSDRLTIANFPRPGVAESIFAGMRLEGSKLAESLAEPGADAMTYLTGGTAFLTKELAAHYGTSSPAAAGGGVVDLPPGRIGFLTTGVFLVSQAHPNKTSPTRRGRHILERILCREVPEPPADVVAKLDPSAPGTTRDVLEQHAVSPACSSCHKVIDPFGFALEGFDHLARPRDTDAGQPVNTDAEFEGTQFRGADGLARVLSGMEASAECLVKQVVRNLGGQFESEAQQPYLDALAATFAAAGHDLRGLVAEAVASDAFRFSRGSLAVPASDQP